MRALTWHGKNDIRCETVPDPEDRARARRHHQGYRLRHLRLGPASVRWRHAHDGKGRCPWPRDHGRGCRGRLRKQQAQGRRPRRRSLYDRMRRMLLLQERLLLGLRALQPQSQDGRKALGALSGRPVRLFPHARRLCRGPGGISPRALCRCRSNQGAAGTERRTGSVPVGYLPDRLHGRRFLQSKGRRDGRHLGLRSRSASSPSKARSCWARNGSSPSTPSRSVLPWPRPPAPSPSTSRKRTSTTGSRK